MVDILIIYFFYLSVKKYSYLYSAKLINDGLGIVVYFVRSDEIQVSLSNFRIWTKRWITWFHILCCLFFWKLISIKTNPIYLLLLIKKSNMFELFQYKNLGIENGFDLKRNFCNFSIIILSFIYIIKILTNICSFNLS